MEMEFWKMNGAGNDFIAADNRAGRLALDRATIARLCDRHRGIGADGLLLAEPASGDADLRMRYYNADGGEAEMCGNGARCFARFADRLLGGGRRRVRFETLAGEVEAELRGERVALAMPEPKDWRGPLDLETDPGQQRMVHFVNTGVPHAVVFVEDVEAVDVRREGAALRHHRVFAPAGTNANFACVEGRGRLALRTYERGVEDETLACGTGVCAAALIYARLHGAPPPVAVRTRGGDILEVEFQMAAGLPSRVVLLGPAEFVFEGRLVL